MSRTVSIILCALSALFAGFWCLLRYKSFLRYYDIINAADKSIFRLPSLLGPGFCLLVMLPNTASKLSSLAGRKLGLSDFDSYCSLSWAVSLILCSAPLCLQIAALAADYLILLCGILISLTLSLYPVYQFRERQKAEKTEIDIELPVIISKLALLSEAGLPLTEAWHRTSCGNGYVYDRMRTASEMMRNGVPVSEAMQYFAEECKTKTARQLAAIVTGKISRGGEGLGSSLRYLHSESWDNRRVSAKLKGQAAASALILPLILMFAGIIMMIAVPLFSGIDF